MTKNSPRLDALLLGVALIAWPGMMLLHECGHLLAAWLTGGTVVRLVWHPLVFSRTDVNPNPSPLIVVWAGPVFGCVISIIFERVIAFTVPSALYIARLFAGFCLIANGAYIGLGWFDRVGDAGEMLRLGSPLSTLILYGILACGTGLFFWHLASIRLGFGPGPVADIPRNHVYWVLAGGVVLNALAFIIGDRGI